MFACAFAQPAPAGALSGDAARGEKLYQACTDCHSLDANDVGPRHRGVFGRKAGSLPDYNYSEALKSANIVWTEETLELLADQSPGARPGRQDVLPYGEPAGPRRRDRLPQGAGEIGPSLGVIPGGPKVRPGNQNSSGAARHRGSPIGRFAAAGNDKSGFDMTNPGPGAVAADRFRAIVPPLIDDAYTLAKWLCRDGADAEDIVQEAAMRALKALETASVEHPKAWFLAIVRNAALTFMARNRSKDLAFAGDKAELDVADPSPDPEGALIALEDGERLRRAIAALPPPLREALVMRDVNGLSYRDVAEATGAPIGTVMSRLARARGALSKMLKAEP